MIRYKQKKKLYELDLKLMQSIEPKITKDVYTFLSPINSINQKKSYDGTSSVRVKESLLRAKKQL